MRQYVGVAKLCLEAHIERRGSVMGTPRQMNK